MLHGFGLRYSKLEDLSANGPQAAYGERHGQAERRGGPRVVEAPPEREEI